MTFPIAAIAPELWTPPAGMQWLAVLLSYLLGSVPFGLVMARLFKGVDLRTIGSGNIGASNSIRAMGKPLGITAGLLDFAKGFVPAFFFAELWMGEASLPLMRVVCGAAAVCGHVWPLYLRFKGGKAVATGCGAIIAIDWVVFAGGATGWVTMMLVFRYAGLSSMVMGLLFPVVAWYRLGTGGGGKELVVGTVFLAALILVRHRSNIGRMLKGTEPKVGGRSASQGAHGKREAHV